MSKTRNSQQSQLLIYAVFMLWHSKTQQATKSYSSKYVNGESRVVGTKIDQKYSFY